MRKLLLLTLSLTLVLSAIVSLALQPASAASNLTTLEAPKGFTIDLYMGDKVILLWEESGDANIEKYVIEKAKGEGVKPTKYKELDAAETSFIDEDVASGNVYSYRVYSTANPSKFIPGYSDVKSISVTSGGSSATPTNTATSNSLIPGLPTEIPAVTNSLLDRINKNFWVSLVAINMLIISLLIMSYLLISGRIAKKRGTVANLAPKGTVTITRKTGLPDKAIVPEAEKRFYEERSDKIKDWVENAAE